MQMSSLIRPLLLAAFSGFVAVHAAPAMASNVTYLALGGTGGTCSSSSPCASMAAALTAAGPNGEVVCLDRGNYGNATITFGVTISCGAGLWIVAVSNVVITTPAGSDVVIEGLVADEAGATGSGAATISFNGQGALHVRRTRAGNATGTANAALDFRPTGPAKLFVTESDFYNMGGSGISMGIHIQPASGVTADVTIERSRIENNLFGIVADGSSGGIIRGVVRDSIVAGNKNNGITVSTGSSNVVFAVERTTVSGNNFGLVATGANAGMLVRNSFITYNNTGLFTTASGVLLSYRDNSLNANTTDGAFSGTVGLQ